MTSKDLCSLNSFFFKTGYFDAFEITYEGICQTNIARVIRIMNGLVVLDIF